MKPLDDAQVADWFHHADQDRSGAALMLPHGLHDLVAYHCQQDAEKCLKALLVALEIDPPHKHDLPLLVHMLRENGVDLLDVDESAQWLTPWAWLSRYPGFGDLSEADARRAIAEAAVIRAAVLAVWGKT